MCAAEEELVKAKSRIKCLALGDKNTQIFHRTLLTHQARKKILELTNTEGHKVEDYKQVKHMIIDFYTSLFTKQSSSSHLDMDLEIFCQENYQISKLKLPSSTPS